MWRKAWNSKAVMACTVIAPVLLYVCARFLGGWANRKVTGGYCWEGLPCRQEEMPYFMVMMGVALLWGVSLVVGVVGAVRWYYLHKRSN